MPIKTKEITFSNITTYKSKWKNKDQREKLKFAVFEFEVATVYQA